MYLWSRLTPNQFDIIKNDENLKFFDEKKNFKVNNKVFKVYGNLKNLISNRKKFSKVFISIGDNKQRSKIYEILKKKKFKIITLKHPKSYCATGSKIGQGTVIMPGCTIQTETIIGNNCIINKCIDRSQMYRGDHTHISPGVVMGGNIKVGKNCWIGLGSKIIPNLIIGDNVKVAAGSVLIKDVKSNSFVKGVPAKNAKKRLA